MKLIVKAALVMGAVLCSHVYAMDRGTSNECEALNQGLKLKIRIGKFDIFQCRLKDISQRQQDERQAILNGVLHEAARYNANNYIQELLAAGAAINEYDKDTGKTALFAAVQSQLIFITKQLNASLSNETVKKLNALQISLYIAPFTERKDTSPAIKLLLERGADPSIANKEGLTPLELALKAKSCLPQDHPANAKIDVIIDLLTSHKAPEPKTVKIDAKVAIAKENGSPVPIAQKPEANKAEIKKFEQEKIDVQAESEAVEVKANPIIQSIEHMLGAHHFFDPFCFQHVNRCHKIRSWTRICSLCGLATLLPSLLHRFYPKMTLPKKIALSAVVGTIGAWMIIPALAQAAYSSFSYIRRKQTEKSLFQAVDQLRDSKPDGRALDALNNLLSMQTVVIKRECAKRLAAAKGST